VHAVAPGADHVLLGHGRHPTVTAEYVPAAQAKQAEELRLPSVEEKPAGHVAHRPKPLLYLPGEQRWHT
jgi:hypothetical protein